MGRVLAAACTVPAAAPDSAAASPLRSPQVVFFNAGPKTRHRHLAIAREVASDPVSSERPYLEGERCAGAGVGDDVGYETT